MSTMFKTQLIRRKSGRFHHHLAARRGINCLDIILVSETKTQKSDTYTERLILPLYMKVQENVILMGRSKTRLITVKGREDVSATVHLISKLWCKADS